MGRQPCCDKIGLKKGPWTVEEDQKLMSFIINNGIQCWRRVPKLAGLLRCGKSCRLRWINYLRPDVKRGALSEAEEDQIIQLHRRLGNKWSKIAAHFPGRTDNEIKNHWNTRIKKRLKLLGLDPVTHSPIEHNIEIVEKSEAAPNSDLSKPESKTSEVNSINNHVREDLSGRSAERQSGLSEVNMAFDETTALLDGNDGTVGGFDVGLWLNQESSIPKAHSPPFFMEDSLNPSVGESSLSSLPDDPLQLWVDGGDSLLCWEGFNQLQAEPFCLTYGQ